MFWISWIYSSYTQSLYFSEIYRHYIVNIVLLNILTYYTEVSQYYVKQAFYIEYVLSLREVAHSSFLHYLSILIFIFHCPTENDPSLLLTELCHKAKKVTIILFIDSWTPWKALIGGASLENRLSSYHKIFTTDLATLDLVLYLSLPWICICFGTGELCGRKKCGIWILFTHWRSGLELSLFLSSARSFVNLRNVDSMKTFHKKEIRKRWA